MNKLTWWLLIIGGINWLLVGLFGSDLFAMIGLEGVVARIVYVLVGLSAVYQVLPKKSATM